MPATLDAVFHDALDLPPDQRLTLAFRLLGSVDSDPDPNAAASWKAEIARRIASLDAGESRTIPAAEVFARLREIAPARSTTDEFVTGIQDKIEEGLAECRAGRAIPGGASVDSLLHVARRAKKESRFVSGEYELTGPSLEDLRHMWRYNGAAKGRIRSLEFSTERATWDASSEPMGAAGDAAAGPFPLQTARQ